MIIEFIGLPGCGKTALSHYLEEVLQKHGIHVWTRSELSTPQYCKFYKFIQYVRLAALWPDVILLVAWHLLTRKQVQKRIAFTSFMNTLLQRDILSRQLKKGEIAILDEGLIHRGASIFGYCKDKIDENIASKYISNVPLPDVLVYLNVTPEIAIERIEHRGRPNRMKDMGDEEIKHIMHNIHYSIHVLIYQLQSKVLEIAADDLSLAGCELERKILGLLCSASLMHEDTSDDEQKGMYDSIF